MYIDPTIQLVKTALDAALMRQTAIAANIAHANTPHYKTVSVNFEQQLNVQTDNASIIPVVPTYETLDKPIALDEQMALNVQNETHFRALIKGLNHYLSIMKLALEGNNRT